MGIVRADLERGPYTLNLREGLIDGELNLTLAVNQQEVLSINAITSDYSIFRDTVYSWMSSIIPLGVTRSLEFEVVRAEGVLTPLLATASSLELGFNISRPVVFWIKLKLDVERLLGIDIEEIPDTEIVFNLSLESGDLEYLVEFLANL